MTITTEQDAAAGLLIVRVQDNGPGIEDTESIFLPFHSTKGRMGTGLGLPIARKIVLAHKGTIEVESIVGEGTIFTVKLPLTKPVGSE